MSASEEESSFSILLENLIDYSRNVSLKEDSLIINQQSANLKHG